MADDDNRPGAGARIETVVFDLGGVLFTEGKRAAIAALARERGYDPAVVGEVMTCPRSRDLRRGLVSDAAFWAWVATWLPEGHDARAIRAAWHEGYVLDRALFELARRLKGRYRLAVFSGNVPERVAHLDARTGFRALFDVEVYSYDHRMDKDDPRFLEALLTALGGPPGAILTIDDSPEVLALAEARGVNTLRYETGQVARIEAAMRRLGMAV